MASGVAVEAALNLNNLAVAKFLTGDLWVGDYDAEDPGEDFLNVDGTLRVNPAELGYYSAGFIDTDGITETRDISVETTEMWQSVAPVRDDVSGDALSLKIKFGEIGLVSQALEQGLTMAEVKTLFANPVMVSNRDISGRQPLRKAIMIAQDTSNLITAMKWFPQVRFTDQGDTAYNRSDAAVWDMTLKAYPDPSIKSDRRSYLAGDGWTRIAAAALEAAGGGAAPAAWAPETAYAVNDRVSNDGAVLNCTVAGTSDMTAPTNPAVGETVVDNGVTWTRVS